MYMSILNVVRLLIKYRPKECEGETLKKLLESAQLALKCRWVGKSEPQCYQKYPCIIESVCQLCVTLSEHTICNSRLDKIRS